MSMLQAGADLGFLDVSMGLVPGLSGVNKFGRNPDVDLAAPEDIWDGGGVWVAPTTARLHNLVSTSASDAAAGVGAQTVRIWGLVSWTAEEVSEDLTLNGVSNVATVNAYVIIHRIAVLTYGTSGPNVGVLTATAQTDGTVTARINASAGQTQMAIYGVPSTHQLHLLQWYASVNLAAAVNVDMTLLVNPTPQSGTGFLIKATIGVRNNGTSVALMPYLVPRPFDGPAIIKIQGATSVDDAEVSAGFDGVLASHAR